MQDVRVTVCRGLVEITSLRDSWNDLWDRSYPTQPICRAEGIEAWCQHFLGRQKLVVLCCWCRGRLVGALPLVRSRSGPMSIFRRLTNCWADAGDLLIDSSENLDLVAAALAKALREHSIGFGFLEDVPLDAPQWMGFQQALSSNGGSIYVSSHQPVGVVDVVDQWPHYFKSVSGNHRSAIKRSLRKLEQEAELRVERAQQLTADELAAKLDVALDIEDRGWKGAERSSVRSSPVTVAYFKQEATEIMNAGCLDLWFLYANEKPIAFEYCHLAKGTCYSHKIGYDPEYARFGPGRLLRYFQLQQLIQDDRCQVFDMLGSLCDSKAKWATRSYRFGRVYISNGKPMPGSILAAFRHAKLAMQRIRSTPPSTVPKLGATRALSQS